MCVGTNAGTVFMFQITLPAEDKRETDRITCQLGNYLNNKEFYFQYLVSSFILELFSLVTFIYNYKF